MNCATPPKFVLTRYLIAIKPLFQNYGVDTFDRYF